MTLYTLDKDCGPPLKVRVISQRRAAKWLPRPQTTQMSFPAEWCRASAPTSGYLKGPPGLAAETELKPRIQACSLPRLPQTRHPGWAKRLWQQAHRQPIPSAVSFGVEHF